MTVEVKIGIQHTVRELVVESAQSSEEVQGLVAEAVAGDGVLSLTDVKGRTVLVPAARIAYLEIGGGVTGRWASGTDAALVPALAPALALAGSTPAAVLAFGCLR